MLKSGWFAVRQHWSALFQRPDNHFAAVDGVRALAQLAVMLYHCFYLMRMAGDMEQFRAMVQATPAWLGWVWTLDYSVDAFFVISGYLITTLLLREHTKTGDINFKRFYWRRYLRLTPAYFAFMLLFLVSSPVTHANAWTNFLYLNNFIPMAEMSFSWTWSLAVEEQFYLVFPAILLWFVLKGSRPFLNLLILLLLSQTCAALVFYTDARLWHATNQDIMFNNGTLMHYFDRFYVNIYTRFGPFISGAILAYVLLHHRERLAGLRQKTGLFNTINVLALSCLLYLCAFNPYSGEASIAASRWHMIADRNLFGIALAWILFAVHGNAGLLQPVRYLLSWRGWYPVAQLSYCMYLFHYPIVLLVMVNTLANLQHFGLLGDGQPFPYHWVLAAYGIVIILTLIPATLLHVLVEKPFMELRNRLGRKTSATPAAALKTP